MSAPSAGRRIAAAGALNTVARVVSQGSQLFIFILAARILAPADFGVFALVSAVAVVLFRISQAGWPEFIMSWTGSDRVLAQVMMVALISGGLAMLGGLGATGVLYLAGQSSEIVLLAGLFAVWVPISTVAAAQHGIMIRRDRLSAAAWTLLAGEAAGFAVSVGALLSGVGVLALAYGRLTQQCVHVLVGYTITLTLPRFGLARDTRASLLGFFWQILMSRVVTSLSSHVVTFVIGGFLGPAAVGFFRAASRITSAALEVIGEPARVMAWARFRAAQDAPGGLPAEARAFYAILVALALPVFLWIAVFAEELTLGLLGPAWAEAAPLVAILALSQVLQLPAFITESVASLTGQLKRLPPLALANAAFAVIVVAVAAPFGLMAVALSQIAIHAVFCGSQLWVQGASAAIRWRGVAGAVWRSVTVALVMAAALALLNRTEALADWPGLLRLAVLTLPAVPVYLGLLLAVHPDLRPLAGGAVRRLRGARAAA